MDSQELKLRWVELEAKLIEQFGKKPDLQGILFLIGLDELSKGYQDFTKEEKQDLIHVGICKVLSYSDYYEFAGVDKDGWPHYKVLNAAPANLKLHEQEALLKAHVIHHFEAIELL